MHFLSSSAWCSTLQCLVALVILDVRNIRIVDAEIHRAGHVKDALEFQGLPWFSFERTFWSGNVKKTKICSHRTFKGKYF